MKTNAHLHTWIFAAFLMLSSSTTFSQRVVTWKGGTPGMKNDWFCPQNWSTSVVPDEFSDVIIPDVSTTSFAFPVIQSGRVEINSLFIKYNGSLTIARDAALTVLGNAEGIVHVNGQIVFKDQPSEMMKKMIAGKME